MRLTRIARDCKGDDCPAVFSTERGTLAVQGYLVHQPTPEHEAIVEIPADLLKEAARALGR
ncbi:hypothetical protein [Amycolatopsis aidingensis]|uniref:hypothetical protein n=1 Tax=Amycolatopsis aidingensis TaxID=2842453 RepID=UPI001C0C4337|nr:hypothetical protein [Amycolatopsis aidingensis]